MVLGLMYVPVGVPMMPQWMCGGAVHDARMFAPEPCEPTGGGCGTGMQCCRGRYSAGRGGSGFGNVGCAMGATVGEMLAAKHMMATPGAMMGAGLRPMAMVGGRVAGAGGLGMGRCNCQGGHGGEWGVQQWRTCSPSWRNVPSTGWCEWEQTVISDGDVDRRPGKLAALTGMAAFKGFCMEELRMRDDHARSASS